MSEVPLYENGTNLAVLWIVSGGWCYFAMTLMPKIDCSPDLLGVFSSE